MLAPVAVLALLACSTLIARTPASVAICATACLAVALVAVAARTGRIGPRLAHAAAAIAWWAPIAITACAFAVTSDQRLFVVLLLELTSGLVMLSRAGSPRRSSRST